MILKGPLPVLMVSGLLGLASGILAANSSPSSSLAIRADGPPPLVIPPSELWEGNDGAWSTFWLSVGTPPQTVRVLASTASNQPWVVLPQGCLSSDPSHCDKSRGNIFQTTSSSSWYVPSWMKNETSSVFTVAIESNLGLTGNARYGYDNISLGANSGTPSLSNQVIGGIATTEFFMGLFGLNPAATSFSTNTSPVPSYMSSLKNQSVIPSLSYGYTAGNKNRNDKVFGSLTLGGYDASLFEPNPLTIAFNSYAPSDLTVTVNHIATSSKDGTRDLSTSSFPALIDSTISHLYLPVEVCKKFEDAFGLVYNETSKLYLVNDALHTKLLSQSPTVTFTLTNSTSKDMVDIALPYSAFDLSAQWPVAQNGTRYFPLKRAANNSQTTLGRTFLQEAYLIADYERSSFSIHQRKWDNAQPSIQSILPLSDDPATAPDEKKPVNTAVIAAGTVGGIAFISIIAVAVYLLRRRSAEKKASEARINAFESMPRDKTLSGGYSTSPSVAGLISPSLASESTMPGRPHSPSIYGLNLHAIESIQRHPNAKPIDFGGIASFALLYPQGDHDGQTPHAGLGHESNIPPVPVLHPQGDHEGQTPRSRSSDTRPGHERGMPSMAVLYPGSNHEGQTPHTGLGHESNIPPVPVLHPQGGHNGQTPHAGLGHERGMPSMAVLYPQGSYDEQTPRTRSPDTRPGHERGMPSMAVLYPPSDFDSQTARTMSPELEGDPGPFRSMASSPVYYPSEYDAQTMRTMSPELEGSPRLPFANLGAHPGRNLTVRDIQRTRSPELEGSPVTPIRSRNHSPVPSTIPESEEQSGVHELPARENVDKVLLDDSKNPAWI